MFCSYQDESQRQPIVFVIQILLRQNKQINHWLAVSLSHRRNGSVIYFGGQAANGQMWSQLNPGIDSDTTHYGSQEEKCQGTRLMLILHPKPKAKQIAIHAVKAAFAFMHLCFFQGGCLTQIDTAGTWSQSCYCKMDCHRCGPRQTAPAVTEVLHGSPATCLYEPIVADLPLHNFHQHKSVRVQRSNLVGRVLVLSKFHG